MIPLNLSRRVQMKMSDASLQQSHPLNLSVKSESQSQSSSSEDGPSQQGIVGSMTSQTNITDSLVEEETTAAFALCQLAGSILTDPNSRATSDCDQTNPETPTNSTKESDSDGCSAHSSEVSASSVKHPKRKTRGAHGTKRKRTSDSSNSNLKKRS